MVDNDPSAALEQRAFLIAKLKRAASLPRMKDGRRPPMHNEAVSEGEKGDGTGTANSAQGTPPPQEEVATEGASQETVVEPHIEPEPHVEPDAEPQEQEPEPEPEQEVEAERETAPTPEPSTTKSKRRSRSRSRSRGSKDLRGKNRVAQVPPSPSPAIPGDSSQDEGAPATPLSAMPAVAPLPAFFSPIPSRTPDPQLSRLLRSPTPTGLDQTMFHPGTSPSTPNPVLPLPSLEALQKGLFRSNSAVSSSTVGRRMAMHKLTGGKDTYDPSPSPTPPPFASRLGRNNTVSGGERSAARQFMLTRIGGRFNRETDTEQASAGEEIVRSPTPKRRRRRSRRASASAGSNPNTGVSDSEFVSTSPNTPVVPPTPLPPSFDDVAELPSLPPPQERPRATPSPRISTPEEAGHERERSGLLRRRSVVVEEEEDDNLPVQPIQPPSLPNLQHRFQGQLPDFRLPHTSDTPSNASSDSTPASAVGVPVFLEGHTTSSRQEAFPSSPFMTPLRERPSIDDDEVLYDASYGAQVPIQDSFEREISWIADPVPEFRIPVDDVDDDEDDEEATEEAATDGPYVEPSYVPTSSARSSDAFPAEASPEHSPRASSHKSVVIESEMPADSLFHAPPSPTSIAALSQSPSFAPGSDDSAPMSPPMFPARLSVASRIQSDNSPMNAEWDDKVATPDGPSKRNGEQISAWDKLKNTFTRTGSSSGRRSRSNSIVTRERRDHTDSSVSRESGASVNSGKSDKGDANPGQRSSLMQSPSASTSLASLSPHAGFRGGPSPAQGSNADLSMFLNEKLFPFPGIKLLEEQRRAKGVASASSPDLNSSDQPTSSGSGGTTSPTLDGQRDRKLSHQASDTRLVARFNSPPVSAVPSSSSQPDSPPLQAPSSPSATLTGSVKLNLPMNISGVRRWLSDKKQKTQTPPATPPVISSPILDPRFSPDTSSFIPDPTRLTPDTSKKPSLSDIFRNRKDNLSADWEDIGSEKSRTPTTTGVSPTMQPSTPERVFAHETPLSSPNGLSPIRGDHTDTEKTPKAQKITEIAHDPHASFASITPPSALPSPNELPLSTTPDPTSSLSDYPAASTSASSSSASSQDSRYSESHTRVGSQGSIILGQLDENLSRSSRSPMWASAVDDPSRKLVLSSPVLQVVNPNTVKDRFLFLFTDLLVIAKPVLHSHDSFVDSYKSSPGDRKYIVKSVVHLRHLRFCDDRAEPHAKPANYAIPPRNPLIRTFVHQFSKDPDHAIAALFDKADVPDDPTMLGQLLFKTLDIDRARLGDYLSRRTSKVVLKSYISSFGFTGMRFDKALRAFLLSINVPSRVSHGHAPMDYLLDSFASRWYDANVGVVAFDKDLALRLVRATVQLNELMHGGIAQEPGPTAYPRRNILKRDFVDAFKREVRHMVPDELLEDIYDSIRHERLCQAMNPSLGAPPEVQVSIKRPLPARLTYKVSSEPIILRIPRPDPHLIINLSGQDLSFEPSILTFAKSSEASFRVTGMSLGPKTMIMCRSGANANKYSGLPLSSPIAVERAFMRNTFQVAFLNQNGVKRRYMFSVDDPLIRHQWLVSLQRQLDLSVSPTSSNNPSKFHRAAESLALRVLQETLLGRGAFSPQSPASAIDKALHKLGSPASPHFIGNSIGRTTGSPAHSRSKSRSQLYHRNGSGQNEPDVFGSPNGQSHHEYAKEQEDSFSSSPDQRSDGPVWTSRQLELQCQQNSSIPLVLSFLQVGAPEHGQNLSS
ncbi:hypothetical protein HGRIS_002653 [Hohenbuehelia grisea]|uniref:SEC7 domain-containing protein n=1 Tax=Hohenbuehelia grisea TaxID=104357 RepID=A0ABR3JLV9_9AGAR